MLGRKVVLSIGLTLLLLLNYGEGQSCPEIPNVANVCESASYTGDRVLLDTSTFTEVIQNCSCTFSTTADMIRIVTYAAPNYQQCNSAIRLYSSSGNAMRFQCLMSGTYLDTTAHKTGGAEFETFGPIYDKNYCLVLEHLGSEADTITISCNGLDQTAATTTDIPTAKPDITVTSVDVSPATTTTAETTTSVADITPSTTDNTPPTSNSIVITTSPREAFTTPVSLSSSSETLFADNGTVSKISDPRSSIDENASNITNGSMLSDNQDQHTSETSDSFSSSHVLLMPNNIVEKRNETEIGEKSTAFLNETTNILKSMDTVILGAMDRDVISNSSTDSRSKSFGNETGNIIFGSNTVSATSQEGIYTTVQTETVRPENLNTSTDNEFTVTQILKKEDTTTTQSPETMSLFGNIDPLKIEINNMESNSTGIVDILGIGDREKDIIGTISDQPTLTTKSPLSNLNGTFGKTKFEINENETIPFENVSLSGNSVGIDVLSFNTSLNKSNKEITSSNMNVSTNNESEINPIKDTSGLENSIMSDATMKEDRATFGNDAIPIEAVTSNLVAERPIPREENLTMLVSATDNQLINNISTNDGFQNSDGDNQSIQDLLIHNRSTLRPDYIPTESSTVEFDFVTRSKTTKTPILVYTSNNDIIDGSVVETKTININADIGVETTTDNSISLLSDLMRESALLDSMVKDSNSDDNNNTLSMTNINRTTFGLDAVGVENESMKSPRPSILGSENTINNDTMLKMMDTKVVSQNVNMTLIREDDIFDQPAKSPTLGLDLVPSNNSVDKLKADKPNGILSLERGFDFIQKDSKPSSSGPDAAEGVGGSANAAIRHDSTLEPVREIFGPGGIISEPMHSTFGPDAVVKDRMTVEPGRATFGHDAVVGNRLTLKPGRLTIGPDTMITDRVTFEPGRSTFGPDVGVNGNVTMEPERETFGLDAVVKDRMTTEPGRETFGKDVVISSRVTMEPGRAKFVPDSMDKDRVTMEPGGATFGQDVVIKDRVTKEPESATFGPDAAISDKVTMEPGRVTFGQDAVMKDGETTESGRATFGPDAAISDRVTMEPRLVPFGPDAAIRHRVTMEPGRANSGPDASISDRVTMEPGRATFGQDAVIRDKVTIAPGRATFGPDAAISVSMTMEPGRATFGQDAVIKDRETMEQGRATFGPNSMEKDRVTIEPERTTFGQDAVVMDRVTMEPGRATFGPDAAIIDRVTMEPGRSTFGQDVVMRDTVTFEPGRATFGPDAVVKDGVPLEPGRATFGPDEVVKSEVTARQGRATFGPDIVDRGGPTFGPRRASFGPDTVVRDGLTIGPRHATFGQDTGDGDGMTSGPGRVTFGPDAITREGLRNGPGRATFGRDITVRDGMTLGPGPITFGPDAKVTDGVTAGPNRATFGSDVLKGDRVSTVPERVTFGHDALSKDVTALGASSVSDLDVSNKSSLNSMQLNEVNDPSITRDNISFAIERTHIGNDFFTRRIFTDGPEVSTEKSTALLNEGIDKSQTTSSQISVDLTTDAPFTRVVFGEFIERRKLLTSTETSISATGEPPIMPLDFVNALDNESSTSFDSKVNSTRPETGVDTQNAIDNQILLNEDSVMSTMNNSANDPVVEETISQKSETSLLNSIKGVSQKLPGSLFDQIMDTMSESSSNSSIREIVVTNEVQEITTLGSKSITVDRLKESSTKVPVTVREMTTLDAESTTADGSTEFSTSLPGTAQDTTTNSESQARTLTLEKMESTTPATSVDMVNSAIEITEGTENIGTTIVPIGTTTQETQDSTTKIITINTSPNEILLTTSTLPPIIPADREIIPLDIQRDEVASVIKSIPSTQRPQRTTKRQYNVMNDEPVLVNDRTVIDGGGVPKTDKDQLNVSLEDEPNKALFDMNNKTYIIVVIAIAGLIILVAIVAVIIRNRRKSNATKSEINNGVSASNHDNAAFDASEAERGNVAPTSNGVEPSKPTVEVIEPNGDS